MGGLARQGPVPAPVPLTLKADEVIAERALALDADGVPILGELAA